MLVLQDGLHDGLSHVLLERKKIGFCCFPVVLHVFSSFVEVDDAHMDFGRFSSQGKLQAISLLFSARKFRIETSEVRTNGDGSITTSQ